VDTEHQPAGSNEAAQGPTPECDALYAVLDHPLGYPALWLAEARRLERQRDALLEAAKLAEHFWYSDHPNDTVPAMIARDNLRAAIAMVDKP